MQQAKLYIFSKATPRQISIWNGNERDREREKEGEIERAMETEEERLSKREPKIEFNS